MHYVSDVQLIAVAIGAVIHVLGSGVAFYFVIRRGNSNGAGIEANHKQLSALDQNAAGIAAEMVIVRGSLTRIQSMLDGRAIRGTRATDIPGAPPMRSPTPQIAGASPRDDPKAWPAGG